MAQYLIAVWDYAAEGEFELSFKQGDRIKLLEKHNDDWWEGELNEQIGFFPANRIRLEVTSEEQPNEGILSNEISDSPLPDGWESAYDEEGTIYYFNESTGESRWDPPDDTAAETVMLLKPEELKKLELNKLQSEWIRHKGNIQMKMVSEKKEEGGKLSSWKVYYSVLSNGFLLLYKDTKNKRASRLPVGSFDLDSCHIDPAGKQDTKRKHVFIISTPHKVKIYIQAENENDFSLWLDAIMRELIARKEGQKNQDTEIMRLLKSLTIDENHMKVNRKINKDEEKKPSFWFTKTNSKKSDSKIPTTITTTTTTADENSVFGGYLRMEENGDIPYLVSACIKEVEARGLKSVGIYRLSGPASSIQKYKTAFNEGEHVTFKDEHDINAVTGLLKLYFRELRDPLMTFDYYDYFMEAARITDYEERMFQIKSIIHNLPKANYIVLEYLMRHLSLVASYSDINKMEASNLALIFSIGLLRPAQDDLSSRLVL
ncbi:hypothetical protein G6F62_009144 [Rhizopus arrhizus]|nr:hypothetical protein G6F62_009144 [Rhizopus arrhizus]